MQGALGNLNRSSLSGCEDLNFTCNEADYPLFHLRYLILFICCVISTYANSGYADLNIVYRGGIAFDILLCAR